MYIPYKMVPKKKTCTEASEIMANSVVSMAGFLVNKILCNHASIFGGYDLLSVVTTHYSYVLFDFIVSVSISYLLRINFVFLQNFEIC